MNNQFLNIRAKLKKKDKVCKKKVGTNVSLNFTSIAPIEWKISLILYYLSRT